MRYGSGDTDKIRDDNESYSRDHSKQGVLEWKVGTVVNDKWRCLVDVEVGNQGKRKQ